MLAHVSKVMEDKKPEEMGPVDSSTARTIERDALLASMLQEIEDRQTALILTWDHLRARARRQEMTQWQIYQTCSCHQKEKEEEKSE